MVLLAYDGSAVAKRALQHAATLVEQGRELAVINVIPAQSVSSRLETVTEEERGRQARILREANGLLARRGIEAQLIEAVGDPATEILAEAEKRNAETIVVGRSEGRHLARGQLDSRLVRSARADVLVVP
ncbi:MAG TPA: universal stress protein [Gaiellaceae bacterium]|nr:universal stress protein [Gaiellaceae bacterium]